MFLKKLGAFILDTIQVIVFAISIFLFVYLLILQPHKIKGHSMDPNFQDGEFLLTDKISYRFNDPQRGDVIVFKAPPDQKEEFIKRIIALPGDSFFVNDGNVYVNGEKLTEDYLPTDFYTSAGSYATEDKVITVGPDMYFVLGDNRSHSLDSRSFGPIERDKITGRAWFVYWPPQKIGTIAKASY